MPVLPHILRLNILRNSNRNADVSYTRDIFLEAGQSNMVGQDGDTSNPLYPFTSTNGYEFDGTSEIPISTLRGKALNGSQSNYFAERYFSLTLRKAVIVEDAENGTGLFANETGKNWSSTGYLRGRALSKLNSALSYYSQSAPKAMLWCQGEMEGQSNRPKADIKEKMQDLINWWQAEFPGVAFIISELGDLNTCENKVGWQRVREIHNEMATENVDVYLGFNGAKDFCSTGKMVDLYHYSYEGLKEMGEAFAEQASLI